MSASFASTASYVNPLNQIVSATGIISSSAALYGEDLFLGSNARINSPVASEIKVLLPLNVSGNITASGTISGSNLTGTNTGDVTLAGSPDYITISGQTITRNTIDIGDDTNLAVSDTTGQTGIDMTLTGDTISGTVSGLTTTSNVLFNNITASGNISASGEFIGASAYITNITASANISASGYVETDLVQSSNDMVITGSNFYIDSNGRYDFDYNITRVETHNMTGDVANFNPTGFQDCNLINVTSNAGGYEISGIVAPSPAYARLFYFQNANANNRSIKFMNNNGSATTGNKIFLRDRANKDLKEQECAGLWYDVTADSGNGGWRPLTRLG